jgi:hypothetical protein
MLLRVLPLLLAGCLISPAWAQGSNWETEWNRILGLAKK